MELKTNIVITTWTPKYVGYVGYLYDIYGYVRYVGLCLSNGQ